MAQLLIRDIEPELKLWLEFRAKRTGRSVGDEVFEIIRIALDKEEDEEALTSPTTIGK